MNIMTVKEQVEIGVSAAVGGGTTVAAFNIDKFIETSTPYIKFIGMVGGVVLTLILCVYWVHRIRSENKASKKKGRK